MARIAVFAPYPDSCDMVAPMLAAYPHLTPLCVECVPTEHVVQRVLEVQRQGCDLVIARGLQATLVRRNCSVPLVEIRATMQEIARPVLELRPVLGCERPVLGLVGLANMFPDLSAFDALFAVQMVVCPVQDEAELVQAAVRAVEQGAQALIGGHTVCEQARRLGVPGRFLAAGPESLRAALELANLSSQAIDLEKRNSAEISVMLDSAQSGMLQVDRDGLVRRANPAACRLLEQGPARVVGRPMAELLPALDGRMLDKALQQGQESCTAVPGGQNRALMVSINPICVDGGSDGVLLTLQEGERIIRMDNELRRELYQRGFIARYRFDNLVCRSAAARRLTDLGKRMAPYPAPVLLQGENGTGKGILAQCLHNESLRRGNAFVALDCSAWLPETVDDMLFGHYTSRRDNPCMAELAEHGTLYLSHLDALSHEAQYKLLCLIRGQFWHNGSNRPSLADVRVVASNSANLTALVQEGSFRADLYYALAVLSMQVPPLRQRREDILGWVDHYLDHWQRRYKRFVRLSQGAQHFLQLYDWPGNLDQVSSLCARVVLLAEKRTVDETFLRRQLEQTSPILDPGTKEIVRYRDRRADRIAELLRRYQGNRTKVAQELGISKTTLWRYIKKYDVQTGPEGEQEP